MAGVVIYGLYYSGINPFNLINPSTTTLETTKYSWKRLPKLAPLPSTTTVPLTKNGFIWFGIVLIILAVAFAIYWFDWRKKETKKSPNNGKCFVFHLVIL